MKNMLSYRTKVLARNTTRTVANRIILWVIIIKIVISDLKPEIMDSN